MDDYDAEITDLPPRDQIQPVAKSSERGGTNLLHKAWIWRLGILIGALLLAFLVVIGSFPSIRDKLAHLLFGPGQPPAPGTIYVLRTSNGSLLWQRSASSAVLSFAVANNDVYFSSLNGSVYALRASDGSLLWQHQGDFPVLSLIVGNGKIYLVSDSEQPPDRVYVLQASNGSLLWQHQASTFVSS